MATQFADVRFNGLGAFSPSGAGIGYLRPDADDVDGGWTNELDGSVLFSSIDEAAPAIDSDYIKSSEDPVSDICQVRLSNPSSLVTTPAKVRTRYKKSAASGTIYLTVRLKQGATDIAEWSYSDISDTFTTSEETLTALQFNSITDFNDLFLEFEATTSPLAALIAGLTADGIFAKLDRLWIFAQATEALALVDLVASATATAVNSPTFTANQGYTGNGTSSYVETNYNPGDGGTYKYLQNDAHFSDWDLTSSTADNTMCGNSANSASFQWFSSALYPRLNDIGGANSPGTAVGHNLVTRSVSNLRTFYQSGASVGTDAAVTHAIQNRTFRVLGATEANVFSTHQLAAFSAGGGLTATEAANFYTRLRTYMTAVGVP
jgi:hypothetical protein